MDFGFFFFFWEFGGFEWDLGFRDFDGDLLGREF